MGFLDSVKSLLRLGSRYDFLKKKKRKSPCLLLSFVSTKDCSLLTPTDETEQTGSLDKSLISTDEIEQTGSLDKSLSSTDEIEQTGSLDKSLISTDEIEQTGSLDKSHLSTDEIEQTGSSEKSLLSTDEIEKVGNSEKAVSIETTVISPTEDEIRAAKKKAKKAKKNFDLAARRREKRRVEKEKKSFLSQQPTANPGEIDAISTIEEFQSVPSSVPPLPEIVADLDMVNRIPEDNGMTTPDTCIEPVDMAVSGEQINSNNAAPESTEVHPRRHSSSSYTAPGEKIVAFFENLVGPVQFFSMFLDEHGLYTGKASVLFRNSGDAFNAMFLCRTGLKIQGRTIKMKLFSNGLQLHPGDFILPSDLVTDVKPSYYWV